MEVTAAVSFGTFRRGKIYEVDPSNQVVQSLLRNGYLVDNGFTEADLATEYELATGGVVDASMVLVGIGDGVAVVRDVRVEGGADEAPNTKVVKRRGKNRAGSEDGPNAADRTGDTAGSADHCEDC